MACNFSDDTMSKILGGKQKFHNRFFMMACSSSIFGVNGKPDEVKYMIVVLLNVHVQILLQDCECSMNQVETWSFFLLVFAVNSNGTLVEFQITLEVPIILTVRQPKMAPEIPFPNNENPMDGHLHLTNYGRSPGRNWIF